MNYTIPEKVFSDFEYISGRNYSSKDHKHIETLAFLIGDKDSSNQILVKDLIYPDQEEGPQFHAYSKGMHGCKSYFQINSLQIHSCL